MKRINKIDLKPGDTFYVAGGSPNDDPVVKYVLGAFFYNDHPLKLPNVISVNHALIMIIQSFKFEECCYSMLFDFSQKRVLYTTNGYIVANKKIIHIIS